MAKQHDLPQQTQTILDNTALGFAVLIGSCARGDHNKKSDIDLLLVNLKKSQISRLMIDLPSDLPLSTIEYDLPTFIELYEKGSLFLFHAFREGKLLIGTSQDWVALEETFVVQKNFLEEIQHISIATELLADSSIFGQKYLMPLVNAYIEIKNACIFYLAHHGIYEFNKYKCFDKAIKQSDVVASLKSLKAFYDYSVRGLNVDLPFDPNDKNSSEPMLRRINEITRGFCYACQ